MFTSEYFHHSFSHDCNNNQSQVHFFLYGHEISFAWICPVPIASIIFLFFFILIVNKI